MPLEDFVLLQGNEGGAFNPLGDEINLWLKRDDIVVGTYEIGEETFDTPPSHFIDYINNNNGSGVFENTKRGTVTITDVDTSTNIVQGTFEFMTVDEFSNPDAPINFDITEGAFRYVFQ